MSITTNAMPSDVSCAAAARGPSAGLHRPAARRPTTQQRSQDRRRRSPRAMSGGRRAECPDDRASWIGWAKSTADRIFPFRQTRREGRAEARTRPPATRRLVACRATARGGDTRAARQRAHSIATSRRGPGRRRSTAVFTRARRERAPGAPVAAPALCREPRGADRREDGDRRVHDDHRPSWNSGVRDDRDEPQGDAGEYHR